MNVLDLKKVNFASKAVFGDNFSPGNQKSVAILGSILDNNLLKTDGTIAIEDIPKWKKSEIWSYIYYLWYHNRTKIEVFKTMTHLHGKKEQASAKTFINGLYAIMDRGTEKNSTLSSIFTKERLIYTTNRIVRDNKTISIPILQNIYKKLLNATNAAIPNNIKAQVKINGNRNNNTNNTKKRQVSNIQKSSIVNVVTTKPGPTIHSDDILVKVDKINLKTDGNYVANIDGRPESSSNADIKVAFGINLVPRDKYLQDQYARDQYARDKYMSEQYGRENMYRYR
jgi:hypothetical protein